MQGKFERGFNVRFSKKSIIMVILLLTVALAACGGPAEEPENGDEETLGQETGEPVALVNGESIDEGFFQRQLDRSIAMNEQQGRVLEGEEGDAMKEQMKEQLIQQLIEQEVLYQEAEAQGIEVTDDEVAGEIEMVKNQFETEEQYQEALEINQFTEEEFESMLTVELTVDAFMEQNLPEVTVEENELREYYTMYEQQYEAQMEAMEQEGQELSEEELAMMELPPYEEMKEELRQQLTMEKQQEHQMALVDELMEEYDIEILI